MSRNAQKSGAKPATVHTFPAVFVADATPSVVFNAVNALSSGNVHPLLFPIAGVPLVDYFLHYFLAYNEYCNERHRVRFAAAPSPDVTGNTPNQITQLFVLTKSKKLKNYVDMWGRKNNLEKLSIQCILTGSKEDAEKKSKSKDKKNDTTTIPNDTTTIGHSNNHGQLEKANLSTKSTTEEGGDSSGPSNPKQFLSGNVVHTFLMLLAQNAISTDFLLVEPTTLLSSYEDLFELFTSHTHSKKKDCCVTKVYASMEQLTGAPPASNLDVTASSSTAGIMPPQKMDAASLQSHEKKLPLVLKHNLFVEQHQKASSSDPSISEVLFCQIGQDKKSPNFDLILSDFVKKGQSSIEFKKNVVDCGWQVCSTSFLEKFKEAVDLIFISDLIKAILVEKFEDKLSSDSVFMYSVRNPVRNVALPRSLVDFSRELGLKLMGPIKKAMNKAKGGADKKAQQGGNDKKDQANKKEETKQIAEEKKTLLFDVTELARQEWFGGCALLKSSASEALKIQIFENSNPVFTTKSEELIKPDGTDPDDFDVKDNQFNGANSLAKSVVIESSFLNNITVYDDAAVESSFVCDNVVVKQKAIVGTGSFVGPNIELVAGSQIPEASIVIPAFYLNGDNSYVKSKIVPVEDDIIKANGHMMANGTVSNNKTAPVLLDLHAYKVSHLVQHELGLSTKCDPRGEEEEEEENAAEKMDREERILNILWQEHQGLRIPFDTEEKHDEQENTLLADLDLTLESPFSQEVRLLIRTFWQGFFEHEPNTKDNESDSENEPDTDDYSNVLVELRNIRTPYQKTVTELCAILFEEVLRTLKLELGKVKGIKESTKAWTMIDEKLTDTKSEETKCIKRVVNAYGPILSEFTGTTNKENHVRYIYETSLKEREISPSNLVWFLNELRRYGDEDVIISGEAIVAWHEKTSTEVKRCQEFLGEETLRQMVLHLQDSSSSSGEESD